LELDPALAERADGLDFDLAEKRTEQAPYRDRRVYITARVTGSDASFVVRDEGPGFDYAALPDPTDPENLEKVGNRGLLLIRIIMDEVRFNAAGNEITMVMDSKK
jgi:anti-sigma regulatory factor (Ser/Thr protein kinase)